MPLQSRGRWTGGRFRRRGEGLSPEHRPRSPGSIRQAPTPARAGSSSASSPRTRRPLQKSSIGLLGEFRIAVCVEDAFELRRDTANPPPDNKRDHATVVARRVQSLRPAPCRGRQDVARSRRSRAAAGRAGTRRSTKQAARRPRDEPQPPRRGSARRDRRQQLAPRRRAASGEAPPWRRRPGRRRSDPRRLRRSAACRPSLRRRH